MLFRSKGSFVGITNAGGIQFFYYATDTDQYVSFRGTNSACNVIADIYSSFTEVSTLDMKFHTGFLAPALEAFNCTGLDGSTLKACNCDSSSDPKCSDMYNKSIVNLLLLAGKKKLHVTGHSLGGAVAAIFSLLAAKKGITVDSLVTFGQPEVTDLNGVQTYEKKFANLINMTKIGRAHV